MGTPVKVASSAANYTAATQDPDLRSQINMQLLNTGRAAEIQESLLHHLHAHPSNWPTTVQSHAISLLRSGEVTTFPALLKRVLDDVRTASSSSSSTDSNSSSNGNGTIPNGTTNGTKKSNGVVGTEGSLAVPADVVEEALKLTQQTLDEICDVEGGN